MVIQQIVVILVFSWEDELRALSGDLSEGSVKMQILNLWVWHRTWGSVFLPGSQKTELMLICVLSSEVVERITPSFGGGYALNGSTVYWFFVRGYDKGYRWTATGNRCIGQGLGRGHRASITSLGTPSCSLPGMLLPTPPQPPPYFCNSTIHWKE